MHPSEDFEPDRELPPESDGLVEDLGLSPLFEVMAERRQVPFGCG